MIGTSPLVAWLSLASVLGNVVLCQQINCKPKDCIDLQCYRVSTGQDGPHTVYPGIAPVPSVTVSCDQTVLGGGWTIWLRRCLQTDDTNFNRTWEEYKNGFGRQEEANSEFYLGNEIVHLLTHNYPSKNGEFRFEAISYNNTSYGLSTDGFSLSSEADKYKLRAGEEHDNVNVLAGSIKYLNDRDFSKGSNKICRRLYKGIHWWFDRCTKFFFFGPYFNTKPVTNIHMCLQDERKIRIPIKRARMLLRPYGDTRHCGNPCINGATCEYVAASDTSHCKCPSTHCGVFCEKKNMCKNNSTCMYDAKTKTEVCQCKSGFTGATCGKNAKASGDFVLTTSDWLSVIGGALIGLAVVGLFIRWQKKKRDNEKAARAREEVRKKNEHSESDSFIFSYFGF